MRLKELRKIRRQLRAVAYQKCEICNYKVTELYRLGAQRVCRNCYHENGGLDI